MKYTVRVIIQSEYVVDVEAESVEAADQNFYHTSADEWQHNGDETLIEDIRDEEGNLFRWNIPRGVYLPEK
jgi:hypothetical protein